MKYWQKIFLSTLILFLTALNMGAYLLFTAAYKTSLESERERSFAEHGFICGAMADDIEAILSRSEPPSDSVWSSFFTRYALYYETQNIFMALQTPNGKTYTNIPAGSEAPGVPNDGAKACVVADAGGMPAIFVSGLVGSSGLSLTTARGVAGMQQRASELSRTLAVGSALMSGVLALALYVLLKGLTLPIKKLSNAAIAVAEGDYGYRAKIRGRDEIAELASRFYTMAQTIETQMTALKQEAQSKQRFIDNLAHEMRTPLAAISGYAQYVSDAAIGEEERLSACGYMARQSARLADISEKLLLLTRLRVTSPVKEKVKIAALLVDVQKTLGASGAAVRFQAGRTVWQSDGTLLSMLLINLITNAIRACGEGCEINVTADDEDITISDNGCGISQECIHHLTEPFYRVDKSRSRDGGGTGLGLSICQSICDCLGHRMQISSEEGKGTTVSVLQVDNDLDTNC